MREQVKKAYDEKHPWTAGNTLMIVMSDVLDLNASTGAGRLNAQRGWCLTRPASASLP